MDELLKSISGVICEYSDKEFGFLDEEHVFRWVSQFEKNDQMLVLQETNRILKKNYISKNSFCNFVDDFVDERSQDKEFSWVSASFLSIQLNGQSQSELLNLAKKRIYEKFNINAKVNHKSDCYLYIDDFLFSGNRLVSDLKAWIASDAPEKCTVYVFFMGWFQYGVWNAQKTIDEFSRSVGKKIVFHFKSYKHLRLENRKINKDDSHVFWPTEASVQHESVQKYLRSQIRPPIFRVENQKENSIFSIERRTDYEIAMLKAGIKILSFCKEPSRVVKPLGYNTYDGFGFGSTMFSFRNCPNNNPLAFWWGDPKLDSSHPFGKWYPLMQRKTYG